MAPLSVAHFLCGGMPPTGVVVVVDSSAINSVKDRGLLALCWVDNEEAAHSVNLSLIKRIS